MPTMTWSWQWPPTALTRYGHYYYHRLGGSSSLATAARDMDPLVGAVGAAALCAVLAQRLPSAAQAGEVASEVVCWGLLPVLFGLGRRWGVWSAAGEGEGEGNSRARPGGGQGSGGGGGVSLASLWAVAAGVAVVCCYRAEVGIVWAFPVLTPLLVMADTGRSGREPDGGGLLSALGNTVWGAALVALTAVLALPGWSIQDLALSVVPAAALFLVYVALMPTTGGRPRFVPSLPDLEEVAGRLSARIAAVLVVVLIVQAVTFGIPRDLLVMRTLSLGIVKAYSWYFIVRATRQTTWSLAAAVGTLGLLASRDPWIQLSEAEAVSPVIASALALTQIIFMLPREANGRNFLWALALIPLVPYLSNTIAIRSARFSALHTLEHPIDVLVRNARAEFTQLLERQSKTYTDAVNEYTRRYGVEPPPGFKAWYEFAAANQSPIIDDFDTIYESVSPFWQLSGKEVAQIMDDVQSAPDIDLWLCSFSGVTAETRCTHPRRSSDRHISDMFNRLLGGLHGVLPDLKFLVNHLDEPRVVVPPADLRKILPPFTVEDLSEGRTEGALLKYCTRPGSAPGRNDNVSTYGVPLVTDRSRALDLCRHIEYRLSHGLLQAPPSFRLIEGLVPVLSPGAPSTMSDILFPSPAYLLEPEFSYNPAADVPWEQKANQLYWTGSTTGAVATRRNHWQMFHRQRFISLAQNLPLVSPLPTSPYHTYLHQQGDSIVSAESSFLNARHYRVHPTRIFQCTSPQPCREQRAFFRRLPWQPADAALHSRLVFDLDGNGISGRYYKLLRSSSCVLKQTILREWHDDRLIPWVHYLPVSMGMGELPEMVRWLVETERGRQVAREVAEMGREWMAKGVREVDVRVYVWRLMLEVGRVGDVERGALAVVPEGEGEGQGGGG